jgi:hypothetical protein
MGYPIPASVFILLVLLEWSLCEVPPYVYRLSTLLTEAESPQHFRFSPLYLRFWPKSAEVSIPHKSPTLL